MTRNSYSSTKLGRCPVLLLPLMLLAGCGVVTIPDSAKVADPIVKADIIAACKYSGFFKLANDGVSLAPVPGLSIAVKLVNAGIDKVCANPERYAKDASTVEWLLKQFKDLAKEKVKT